MIRSAAFGSRPRTLPLLRLLAASCFLAFLVAQSPHLVHHLFEPVQNQGDCAFASAAERAQGLTGDVVPLISAPELEIGGPFSDHQAYLGATLTVGGARAPPLLAS